MSEVDREGATEDDFAALARRYAVLEAEHAAYRQREALHKALGRLQEEIWKMQRAEDIQKVLQVLQNALTDLGIVYLYCSVNVVDTQHSPPTVAAFNIAQEGPPKFFPLSHESARNIVHFWRSEQPVYRNNLQLEDVYGEGVYMSNICSVLDVPFSHGTLAISNRAPDAFSGADIDALQELANAISSVYSRYLNFQRLEEQNRTLADTLRQLKGSEERLRSITQSAIDAIIVANSQGQIVSWNKGAQNIFGYGEEIIGQSLTLLMPEQYRQAHQDGLDRFYQTGQMQVIGKTLEMEGLRKDGNAFPMELSIGTWYTEKGTFFSGIIRDITRRKEAEEALQETRDQLVLQEKMASLGNLVAGIVHELNTPLGAMVSMHDTLRRAVEKLRQRLVDDFPQILTDDTRLQGLLSVMDNANAVIADGGERVVALLDSLRNFARLDEAEYQVADLHQGIDSALTLLQSQLGESIHVVRKYGDLSPIHCSPGQLNQVFMHVLKNSLEAIEDQGRITIETRQDKERVVVHIADTGKGIPLEQLATIFDFGFNDQGARVQMGFGLSTAYAIVQEHGGEIDISSQLGQGTQVAIELPRKRRENE
ncbi:MAG: PAS domain S-box protein [Candidatus Latescibacteria bacterium]|nr:PAS domain S-box protein [Candidatus Latescibacterota bacterium]